MEDRRSVRTKKALKNALIELLQKKEINSITVTDLSELADVGRGTFYLHYQNPFDLLDHLEDDIINDLVVIEKEYLSDLNTDLLLCLEKTYDYLLENKKIIKILMDPQKNFLFLNKLKECSIKRTLKNFEHIISKIIADFENSNYIMSFFMMGVIGILQEWVQKDMNLSPRKLAEITVNILNVNISRFIK